MLRRTLLAVWCWVCFACDDSMVEPDALGLQDAGVPRDATPGTDVETNADADPRPDVGPEDSGLGRDGGSGEDADLDPDAGPSDRASTSRGPGPRQSHRAVLLSDGRVLIVGGFGGSDDQKQFETFVFDPTTDLWQDGPSLPIAHQEGTLVAGPNGTALIFGGCRMEGLSFAECTDRVDLIDVDSSTVTLAGRLTAARTVEHVFPLVAGPRAGEHLIIGGTIGGLSTLRIESFDLSSGTSTSVPSLELPSTRIAPTVIGLANGTILLAGGNERPGGFDDLDTALLIDPATLSLTPTNGLMTEPRRSAGAVVLAGGQVLLLHGRVRGTLTNGAELYDPTTETFSVSPFLPATAQRTGMGIVSLSDGRVLVIGGSTGSIVDEIEVYTPGAGFSIHPTTLPLPTAGLTATLLEDGRVLIVGGQSSGGMIIAEPMIFTP